jgi:hypothetical protein
MARPGLDERLKQLGADIEAARARISNRRLFENDDIGDLLEAINDDLEVSHDDPAAAHAHYDGIEARLTAARARLEANPER